jgi:zinc protease
MRMQFVLAVLGASVMTAPGASGQSVPTLEHEKYELPNGLDVILHEDHTIPVVAVNVWYHVGSKNEKPGRTGFAHLFEHMMLQGSEHHDGDYFVPIEKIGGETNASTSADRTNYWENVPSNYLELALWLEADRMGFLLPAMTQEKLDNQRDVVKNERRQGLENEPYGKVREVALPLLYPEAHPYSWPVIGSMRDLSAASLEDVQEFFRQYYSPNNASLCIAGDFDPAVAKRLVEKYFASIPPGPPVDRLEEWVPSLTGVTRARVEDNVNLPRLYVIWHTPPYYKPGDAELDLLANVLSSGKTSRLYRALVYEAEIAQDVAAYQASQELGSAFYVVVTAREGHSLEEIEQAVDRELARVIRDGITADELRAAKTSWEAWFVRNLQEVGGFSGRADRLNAYNVHLGDPDRLEWDVNRYRRPTAEDVRATAERYLDPNRRVILHAVPHGSPVASAETSVDRTVTPEPAAAPVFAPPTVQRAALSNGLQLLVVEDRRLPLVQARLLLRSGWSADPPDRFGAASLTAELLDEGTRSRTALAISEEAKRLGAELSTHSTFDVSTVNVNVLRQNLTDGLALMADVVMNPTFEETELERQRKLYLGRIQQEEKEPFTAALKTHLALLYGKTHPYGQPYTGSGTVESIGSITRDDLLRYYAANYVPNNAALILVGDITLEEARSAGERAFKSWKPGTVVEKEVPEPAPLTATRIVIVDRPGAAQSVIVVGGLGVRRTDADYLPFDVMNNAFGGQFTSRINMNLRESKGYTYGAFSFFFDTRGVGPFTLVAPVQTDHTVDALTEIVKEIRDVVGDRPLSDVELMDSKSNLIKGFPQGFETLGSTAYQVGQLVTYDLPQDEWTSYAARVAAVDGGQATLAAKRHLNPDALLVVVLGDREKIEAGIRALELGEMASIQ